MKKSLLVLGLALASATPFAASAADYVIDTQGAHASINFKVSHLGYSYTIGRFNTFEGTFSYDPEAIDSSKVSVKVDTTSLDSNHAERDKHLRSADFIDASKYPTATFVSKKVEDKGDGDIAITGDLTLHGKTKPVTIDAEFIGAGDDPWGGKRAGFQGETTLNLADFDIKAMGLVDKVEMHLYVEGIQQ
ncbi:YceI family protein [Vibrio sp.]|uniref:YceI family protein n=1 Tax=Vibrio viridaestus TaxID=2487322 RepID=A0A3N9TCS1_9VIBR|nr:YceI family protein [Vibrio viridaestus]MDC0611465.1 YceI family protein [Vibrio sp.]RQW61840.1 YceI family protein [Vibrio viridaestus]